MRNQISDLIRRLGLQVSYTTNNRTSIIISDTSNEIRNHSQGFTSQDQTPIVSLNWAIDFAKTLLNSKN